MEKELIKSPNNINHQTDFSAVATQYLKNIGGNLAQKHTDQFIHLCKHYQLDPFKREIYGIPYGDKFNIIVGYESYIKRADLTGLLVGWKAFTEGTFELNKLSIMRRNKKVNVEIPAGDLKGCILIYRKGWEKPFYHEVMLNEYAQPNEMWCKKPVTMIKKVAIAQAFRLCFPVQFGGMPYTSDEMGEEVNPIDIVEVIEDVDEQDFSVEFHDYMVDMEAIKALPHLDNWMRKHAIEIREKLPDHERQVLRNRAFERLETLKAAYKETKEAERESFDCPIDGASYVHEDCEVMACRQHCKHFNPDHTE